jgi:hypothetical protein
MNSFLHTIFFKYKISILNYKYSIVCREFSNKSAREVVMFTITDLDNQNKIFGK